MARAIRSCPLQCEEGDEGDEKGETMTQQTRKMSEMISEMAAQFISGGKTPEEKHHRLTAACSAWNMACGSPEIQRQQLEQYVKGYRQTNPVVSPSDLTNILKVMQSLIERKLELFP